MTAEIIQFGKPVEPRRGRRRRVDPVQVADPPSAPDLGRKITSVGVENWWTARQKKLDESTTYVVHGCTRPALSPVNTPSTQVAWRSLMKSTMRLGSLQLLRRKHYCEKVPFIHTTVPRLALPGIQ